MIKFYAFILIFGLIGTVGFGAYREYNDMKQRIETLRENNVKLKIVAEENQKALEQAQEFAVEMGERNSELHVNLQKAEVYTDKLRGKLQRHDLTLLSLKKPGLIEKRVNNATQKVWDEIETISGADSTSTSN
jgi:predicted negative regulator of RcsB-dependent stress response|tara:strand:+ start:906 stop:1304 length:399 start_codon:yes stop_codon:yes gene_type:complete